MHNALMDNHFIDLLAIYGTDYGFEPDDENTYASRIRALSSEFRRQVVGALVRAYSNPVSSSVVTIPQESLAFGAPSARNSTRQALESDAAIIVNPVLANEDARVIARLPLLLRPDVARLLLNFPQVDHYVPVIIKRRNLQFLADDSTVVRPSCIAKALPEAYVWLTLLSDLLSINVSHAAVMGLSPSRNVPVPLGAFPVDASPSLPYNPDVWCSAILDFNSILEAGGRTEKALIWRTLVEDEGRDWLSISEDTAKDGAFREGLSTVFHTLAANTRDFRKRPNMKLAPMFDWPWHYSKRKIATDICELTLVSGVNNSLVKDVLSRGLPNNYKDKRITTESLGVATLYAERSLKMCKADYAGPKVLPSIITHNRFNWRLAKTFDRRDPSWYGQPADLLPFAEERSFYVDFELASIDSLYAIQPNENDLPHNAKEVSHILDVLPARAASLGELRTMIFLIGCGRIIKGEWSYRAFVADNLDLNNESNIVQEWLEYMYDELPSGVDIPYVFVWGPEQQLLKKAMKDMTEDRKVSLRNLSSLNMVNMLQVVSAGIVAIQGNHSNALKQISKALDALGLLPNVGEVPRSVDLHHGLDVMAVALDAVESMRRDGIERLSDVESMKRALAYNEMDCLQLARITSYLRENH